MGVSNKVREWFQREHGYSLADAFEVMQPEPMPQDEHSESAYIGRGYPFCGSMASLKGIDSDNAQLADRLAKNIGRAPR